MPKTVCYFQDSCLKNDQYNKWVRKKDSDTAFCLYCSRDIKVGNKGESDLKSHILSKRYKEKTPSLSNIASLLTPHQDQSAQKGKIQMNQLQRKQLQMNQLRRNYIQWTSFL